MRPAHPSDHATARRNSGLSTEAVCPRARRVNKPRAIDLRFDAGQGIPESHSAHRSVSEARFENLGVISNLSAGADRCYQPLGYQALGEFTLCVLVIKTGQVAACLE